MVTPEFVGDVDDDKTTWAGLRSVLRRQRLTGVVVQGSGGVGGSEVGGERMRRGSGGGGVESQAL
ncbi:hypothetical protein CRUP_035506 [Coryphaenoides rupestris]|nr:hypothetical protein CRUP_035506 [Coryphaenoides rupestris]